ncbi:MAG TPA: hypothetical protein VIL49_02445, partial [Capillimicrobium sp.]
SPNDAHYGDGSAQGRTAPPVSPNDAHYGADPRTERGTAVPGSLPATDDPLLAGEAEPVVKDDAATVPATGTPATPAPTGSGTSSSTPATSSPAAPAGSSAPPSGPTATAASAPTPPASTTPPTTSSAGTTVPATAPAQP